MKRIVAFIFVLLTVFSLIPFSALAGDAQTGILAELAGATVGGAAFDLGDYPKKDGASAELLAFMERNYRYDGDQSDYRMEVYIYNPSEKAIVTGGKNTIEMAVKFDENGVAEDYEKFNLRFLEKTENNRFYKFAVVDHVSAHDGNKIVSRVDRAVRRYTVSGFEVQYVGASNGVESPVGKSFRFVGYQSEKNLSVSTGLVETIELDVHQTYWRSQTSSLGEGHQNQLTSVYFAVPEKYFDKYGVLQAVKAGWNEQKTAPIVIVDNQSVYTGLKSFLGVDAAGCQYGFYDEQGVYNGSGTTYFYRYIYNVEKPWNIPTMYFKDYISPLPYVFYDANITTADIGVSGPVLRKHIQGYQYADWLFADAVDEGRKKGYQEQTIYADELLNLKTFGSTHDWFTTWFNYSLKGVDAYEDLKNIRPIYEVQASDVSALKTEAAVSEDLYVAEDDVAELRQAYTDAVESNSRLMLFRFAATDYHTEDISHFFKDGDEIACNGYVAEETVFLDFDIIALSFYKNGVSTVIPVASDPQDVVSDITSPNIPEGVDLSWVKRLLMLIAVLVLIVVCWQPLMMVFDAVSGLFYNMKRRSRK